MRPLHFNCLSKVCLKRSGTKYEIGDTSWAGVGLCKSSSYEVSSDVWLCESGVRPPARRSRGACARSGFKSNEKYSEELPAWNTASFRIMFGSLMCKEGCTVVITRNFKFPWLKLWVEVGEKLQVYVPGQRKTSSSPPDWPFSFVWEIISIYRAPDEMTSQCLSQKLVRNKDQEES